MRKVKSFGDRRRRHCFLWPVLLAGALVSTPSRAGELEVPSALYDTIAEALEAAADGDEIVLVNATYGGPGNRDLFISYKRVTIRSASDVPGSCTIDCGGSDRAFIFSSALSSGSIIRGIKIVNGHADVRDPLAGGAILCLNSSPMIVNCIFQNNNSSGVNGGAIACVGGSSPTIKHCHFQSNNSWLQLGGAIYSDNSALLISHCTFVGNGTNAPALAGGAIYCHNSRLVMSQHRGRLLYFARRHWRSISHGG